MVRRLNSLFLGISCLFLVSYCGSRDALLQGGDSDFFVQSFNPPFLDILWVVDNRSPMYIIRDQLTQEATNFFTRLDAITSIDYRMAFATADNQLFPGLKPTGHPLILTKNMGTIQSRTQLFKNTFLPQVINLQTGPLDQGFGSALNVLQNQFQPRAGVPLVLIFVSDSDDHSLVPTGDAVDYYSRQFQGLTGNQVNLLQVYSINYEKGGSRCATQTADIDLPGFQDRYFRLANALQGQTADLCASFSDNIDLTGLQLTQLPSTFTLSKTPDPSSIQVNVEVGNGQALPSWTYDATNNQIVFASPPPAGSTIQITYNTK